MSDEKELSLTLFLATLNAVSNGWNWPNPVGLHRGGVGLADVSPIALDKLPGIDSAGYAGLEDGGGLARKSHAAT